MYESEVNDRWEGPDAIPEAVRKQWATLSQNVVARTLIPWGEHCTECAIPKCFKTCDLYQYRKTDWSCQRFYEGTVCVTGVDGIMPWLQKIHFKKWAKLWADGTTGLKPLARANRLERMNRGLGKMIYATPMPKRVKKIAAWKYRFARERWAIRQLSDEKPDYFLVEAYNPSDANIDLTLYMKERYTGKQPYRSRFIVPPGLHRIGFPLTPIQPMVDMTKSFDLEISPSVNDATPLLYFGCMDFVRDPAFVHGKPGGCKCVVWDLDNTVWEGTLVEDGPDKLKLKPGIKEIFAELDRRGILISVASKNNAADVMPVLQRFGLADYILKPEISWEPKGQAVRRIAKGLNIGIESLVYVDDSPFERAEVASVCPEVTIIDEVDANWLLSRDEFQALKTDESSKRRQLYQEQGQREQSLQEAAGDYEAFLRDCNIQIRVLSLDENLLPRMHELAQRTNQMNFSGTRYSLEQLEAVRADKNLDAQLIEVSDRFGSYGIVGFAIINRELNVLTDLAFSCRIQSKRIEHAFLAHLLGRYPHPFYARWRKTEKNAPTGRVFADLGFRETSVGDGVTQLEFSGAEVPQFDYISLQAVPVA